MLEKLRDERKAYILADIEKSRLEAEKVIARDAEWAALCERIGFAPCLSPCDPHWNRRGKWKGWEKKCRALGIWDDYTRLFETDAEGIPLSWKDDVQEECNGQ